MSVNWERIECPVVVTVHTLDGSNKVQTHALLVIELAIDPSHFQGSETSR